MDYRSIADELMGILNTGKFIAPLSSRVPGFDLQAGYAVADLIRAQRAATGDKIVGRKIGFTNRTLWARYNVYAPIWNYVWASTQFELPNASPFSIEHLSEPRIEPEVILGIKRTPLPGMTPRQIAECIEWVSHGFEIVQSVYPGWKFTAADCTAAFGLHGALLVGPRHTLDDPDTWVPTLQRFSVRLFRNGGLADEGVAANILDGPLQALGHLVDVIAAAGAPPLLPGEMITTGTITDAFPAVAGDSWSTNIEGIALEGASMTFA